MANSIGLSTSIICAQSTNDRNTTRAVLLRRLVCHFIFTIHLYLNRMIQHRSSSSPVLELSFRKLICILQNHT
jgi:hypothetical protein